MDKPPTTTHVVHPSKQANQTNSGTQAVEPVEESDEELDEAPRRAPAKYLTRPHPVPGLDDDPKTEKWADLELDPMHVLQRRMGSKRPAATLPADQDDTIGEPLIAASDPTPTVREPQTRVQPAPDDDACDAPFLLSEMGDGMVGKRVQVHALKGKGELNGRQGLVASYDKGKDRYRVRLDAETIDGLPTVLGFKSQNLKIL